MRVAPLLPLALALGFALALPQASAQLPTPPAPGDVVATACGVADAAPVHVPICPVADAPAPADPNAKHEHTDAPASPRDAQALAQDAAGQVQGAAQDPPSAPDRAAALVATVVQFVKDVLHLPALAGARLHAAAIGAGDLVAKIGVMAERANERVATAGERVANAAAAVVARIVEIVHLGASAQSAPLPPASIPGAAAPDRVTKLLPGDVGRVLQGPR